MVVGTKHLVPKKFEKSTRGSKSGRENGGGGGGGARGSSSSHYLYKQHFALNYFQCQKLHQQSAKLQQSLVVCEQDLHFNRLQGVHL